MYTDPMGPNTVMGLVRLRIGGPKLLIVGKMELQLMGTLKMVENKWVTGVKKSYLENIAYHFFRQLWLVFGVKKALAGCFL